MAKQRLSSAPERTDDFKEALKRFKESSEHWQECRKNYIEDLRFCSLGEQWPDAIRKQREQDGRPCLTINKLPAYVRQVVNDARQNKPQIKIHPVDDGSDVETAEIITGLIRNIEYTSDSEVAYDTALESAVVGGFGFIRVDLDYATDDTFDKDLKICKIGNPLTVYQDAHTEACDSSDWTYCFVTELITEAEHKARFPGKEISNFSADSRDELNQSWFDEKLVRIAEYWCVHETEDMIFMLSDGSIIDSKTYENGKEAIQALGLQVMDRRTIKRKKVYQRMMNGYEWLDDEVEWAGKYIPIVPVYGEEVNDEGVRKFNGMVRKTRDSQMMFNFWRTATTELVALAPKAPWIGPLGAFKTDSDKWATANVQNHSYIEYDGPVAPQRMEFNGVPAGALQEALNASDDIKSITGIYDAAMGARSNETSGKAILARQRESDIGTFHYIDNLSRAIRHIGRILVDLIPKVYSTARVIRVIGQDESNELVKINEPHEGKEGKPALYNLTTGKYDVTCEAGPSYTTQREEAAAGMVEFVRSVPQAGQLIGDLIAKNLDWPGADEIAERLKMMLPPAIQQKANEIPPAVQQAMQQMQHALQQAQQIIAQTQKENEELKASHEIDIRKVQIDGYNAETNRIKAVGTGMAPQDVQALVIQTLQQVLTSPDVLPAPQQVQPTMPGS